MKLPEGMFTLNKWDFTYGVINAVMAAVIFALGSIVSQENFSVYHVNWEIVFNTAIKAAMAALVGHLGSSFVTDKKGVVAGVIATR